MISVCEYATCRLPRTSIVFALSPRLLLAYRLHVSDFNVCSAWVYYQLQVTTLRLLLYSVATAELLVTFENGCDLGDRLTAGGRLIGSSFLMASFCFRFCVKGICFSIRRAWNKPFSHVERFRVKVVIVIQYSWLKKQYHE